jgi:hypothetical protein
MHDGSIKTLEEVVEFYDKGGTPNPNLDQKMKPLKLTEQDKKDLGRVSQSPERRELADRHRSEVVSVTLMKNRLLFALGALLVLTTACNRDHKKTIAVIPKGNAHIFWQSVHAGAVAASREPVSRSFGTAPPARPITLDNSK